MHDALLYEKLGQVVTLTINRPDKRNPIGMDGDAAAFEAAKSRINADLGVSAVILTGAGKAFSAGGNLKAMQEHSGEFSGPGTAIRESYRRNIHGMVRAVWDIEVPVIAAVNGPAIGLGNDVACLADMRIAASNAIFGATFLKVGLVPGDGGAWLLPKVIGMPRAAELLYTAKTIDAETALSWGLINQVVAPDALMSEAMAMALEVCKQPPQALRMSKRLMRAGLQGAFDTVLELSAAMQALAHQTQDHQEAVDAFFEKRDGVFTGN